MSEELERLRELVLVLAERLVICSRLLTKKAERPAADLTETDYPLE